MGHDGFLIETEKISTLLKKHFNYKENTIDDFQKIKIKNMSKKLTIGLFGYGVVGTQSL